MYCFSKPGKNAAVNPGECLRMHLNNWIRSCFTAAVVCVCEIVVFITNAMTGLHEFAVYMSKKKKDSYLIRIGVILPQGVC